MKRTADVVVIGAGIVGASVALLLAESGLRIVVVDRGPIAGGTTGAGEGNILVSDKGTGPELILARRSRQAWFEMSERTGGGFELEDKGGIMLTRTDTGLNQLRRFADQQRHEGVIAEEVNGAQLRSLEPHLARDIERGIFYPEDAQCQPMLAAAYFLRTMRRLGGEVIPECEVIGFDVDSTNAKVTAVRTSQGEISTPIVINAAGTWAGEVARRAGSNLPIAPRRGFILVTTPAPTLVHHKVYDADYVANVASDNADLQCSAVVERTSSGTILIGASRERVGFDRTFDVSILRILARQAIALFPVLAQLDLLRAYRGFRPYAPDHLPVIGEDPKVSGLYHCAGHEGAGISLAPASAELIRDMILGRESFMDPTPFRPARFLGTYL